MPGPSLTVNAVGPCGMLVCARASGHTSMAWALGSGMWGTSIQLAGILVSVWNLQARVVRQLSSIGALYWLAWNSSIVATSLWLKGLVDQNITFSRSNRTLSPTLMMCWSLI